MSLLCVRFVLIILTGLPSKSRDLGSSPGNTRMLSSDSRTRRESPSSTLKTFPFFAQSGRRVGRTESVLVEPFEMIYN